jgi:hypothetical protein
MGVRIPFYLVNYSSPNISKYVGNTFKAFQHTIKYDILTETLGILMHPKTENGLYLEGGFESEYTGDTHTRIDVYAWIRIILLQSTSLWEIKRREESNLVIYRSRLICNLRYFKSSNICLLNP